MIRLSVKITRQELEDILTSKEAYCATMNRLYREAMLPYFFYIDESGTIQIEKGRYYDDRYYN